MNVIISFNIRFAGIIPCVTAVHFFKMEGKNGFTSGMIFILIHPGICRRVQGFQNFVASNFPNHSYIRITTTVTSMNAVRSICIIYKAISFFFYSSCIEIPVTQATFDWITRLDFHCKNY